MTKRYYWLKLDEKFFEDDTIEWIEEQENGKDYVIFYLKLCLKSLKDEGKLIRYVGERLIPYDVKALAKLTNTSADTVAVAMRLFLEIGLVSNLESGEIYLNQINEMIGTETDVAKRVRKHRAKQEALGHKPDSLQSNKSSLQSNTSETKCNTEIEIEKEIEIELDKEDITTSKYQIIIDSWNELGLAKIRSIKSNRLKMLKARINEYSQDEVIQAIKSIGNSSFLKGQNNRNWIITFDWFIKPNNFIKVLEGNYLDKEANNGSDSNRNGQAKKTTFTEEDADRAGVLSL